MEEEGAGERVGGAGEPGSCAGGGRAEEEVLALRDTGGVAGGRVGGRRTSPSVVNAPNERLILNFYLFLFCFVLLSLFFFFFFLLISKYLRSSYQNQSGSIQGGVHGRCGCERKGVEAFKIN